MAPAPSRTITSEEVANLRLQALGLVDAPGGRRRVGAVEVVRHHLAMQAQDWSASRWAIGSRNEQLVDGDVLAAYDAGEIVRSWPMRGTVHAVVAEDLPWMLELMGVRALGGVARRWQNLGIDEPLLERAREVAVERLIGGRRATRTELFESMREAGLPVTGQLGYHVTWYLAQTGTLVMGPTLGSEHQVVLLDEWVPEPRRLDRDAALAELGARYLRARGPATVEDLVHWTKLTKRDCRAAIDANRDDLVELDRDGTTMFMLRELHEQLDPRSPAAADAVLAPTAFDEHLLGYRDRSDVLDPRFAARVDPARNGVFRRTIVAGCRVVATWSRTKRTKYLALDVTPFEAGSPMTGVEDALHRYGRFVGSEVRVTFVGAPVL